VAPAYGGVGAQPPNLSGGQLFTPGLTTESQSAQQQVPPTGSPYYGQQQGEPEYINAPGYGQPTVPGYGAGGVGQLTDQFGQMGVNGGQKPFQIYTTNLLTSPPDPRDLELPPPPIRLPPGSSLVNSPLANAHHSYQRSTVNAIPNSSSIVGKSKIPMGLIITPYRSVKEGEEPVPVVADTVIARCRRCRTYINPYVQFIDGGNRCVFSVFFSYFETISLYSWRCCMCGMSNEVPQLFDWDQTRNQPGDRWARAELTHSVVEFVAPTEYMVRPPQPAVYIFLIDVSHSAIQSGTYPISERYCQSLM
jgi:protein transport protein SEC24